MWKKTIAMLLVALLIIAQSGCEKKSPVALGEEWQIYAVADSLDWQAVGDLLKSALEKKLVTPQVENEFEVIRVDPKDFGQYLHMRNLLLVSSLQPGTTLDRILHKSLSDETYRKVVEKKEYLLMARDQWSRDQYIVILVSPDRKTLRASIKAYPDYVYQLFNRNRNRRVQEELFMHTNGRLEKRLKKQYGWTIKIPAFYDLAGEDSSNAIVHLQTPMPERHIFVYWLDKPDRKRVNEAWLREQISKIGKSYHGFKVVSGFSFTTERRFQGRAALTLYGLWASDKKAEGGPIQAVAFYDRNLDRIYVIISLVYAPNQRKEPYLRELALVRNTFMTAAEEHGARMVSMR